MPKGIPNKWWATPSMIWMITAFLQNPPLFDNGFCKTVSKMRKAQTADSLPAPILIVWVIPGLVPGRISDN